MNKIDNIEGVKRVANEILSREKHTAIAFINMKAEVEEIEICQLLIDELKRRGNRCSMIEGTVTEKELKNKKEENDIVIVSAAAVDKSADAVEMAGYCDGAILILKKGKVVGKNAIRIKNELCRNKAKCFGTILVK